MERIQKLTTIQIFAVLLLIGVITHISIFFNGFVGDDVSQIYNVGIVKGISDLPKVFLFHHIVLGKASILGAYYKPLMLFYFYFIRSIFGLNPFFYHTPQVLLVIFNSCLAFVLFTKFFKKHIAFILSALFLIHPINQETAAYVSNIQEVLFFLFGMWALLIATKSTITQKKYFLLFLLLLLSLLSKETGILFLAIVLVYTFLFRQGRILKNVAFSVVTLTVYFTFRLLSSSTDVFWIEPPPMASVSLMQRLMHIPLLFFYYIKTFFFPDVLSFNQQWVVTTFNNTTFWFPLVADVMFASMLLIALCFLFNKRKKGKTVFLFFLIWFLLGIIPHLQIIPLDATVATRWFYFSSVGALGMIGVGYEIIEKWINRMKQLFFLLMVLICVLFGIRTMVRNTEWTNAFTLYSTDFNISKSALLENNLGDEYFKKADYRNAEVHFRNALSISPHLWIAINNLGILAEKKGDLKKALKYYKEAYAQGERLPVAENISRIFTLQKKYTSSKIFINQSLKKYPFSASLWLTLALVYYEQGDYKKALPAARKAYDLSPEERTINVINAITERIAQ